MLNGQLPAIYPPKVAVVNIGTNHLNDNNFCAGNPVELAAGVASMTAR